MSHDPSELILIFRFISLLKTGIMLFGTCDNCFQDYLMILFTNFTYSCRIKVLISFKKRKHTHTLTPIIWTLNYIVPKKFNVTIILSSLWHHTLPMTSLRLSLSLSMTVMTMVVSLRTWAGTSKGKDSLNMGFKHLFITTVFFFSTRLSLFISHTLT